MSINLRNFDQRTFKRNLEKGVISEADYKKYLDSLPDDAENSEILVIKDDEEDEFYDDELDEEVTQDLSEEV